MIEIQPTENDDIDFIKIVERTLNSFIQSSEPDEIYIVKIDHWFDFKWREFAGKLVGTVGFWNKELRIPPFVPDRVSEQLYFDKVNGTYEKQDISNLHIYQSSRNNITGKRKLISTSNPRFYFWFSGNTKVALRGSIMLYQIEKENEYSWYVSFLKKENWQIYKTDGISRNEILAFI